jgi:ribonuclease P protein subunit RPR2
VTTYAQRRVRLLICDDAPEIRAMVTATLADHPAIDIVGEAANGEEAIERAIALVPDVVLMDVEMPVLGGIEATRRLCARLHETRVVAFAGSGDSDVVMAMIAAGATAYCAKSAGVWELERAIVSAADPLVRLARAIATASSPTAILELVGRELRRLTGSRQVSALTRDEVTDGTPDAARRALAESSLVRSGDSLAIPLGAGDQSLGVLLARGVTGTIDLNLAAAMADLAASALVGEQRRAESAGEARRDPLTGVGNRRAFDERLAGAFEEGAETTGVSVALLDLDEFKHINDTRGHAAGDRVLRQVAVALLRETRASEDVFRIGGDEFAVVVEGDSSAAFRVAARMRAALVRQRRGEPLPTLSAGVAGAPADASNSDGLLRAADAALYAAKWSGRNRVVMYSTDPRGPPVATTRTPQRILVVDDDPGLRALLRATFAGEVEVTEATDAQEAAGMVRRARPDVIVLDVEMPGMDGVTFSRSLKDDPTTREIRIVLLTGLVGAEGEDAAHRSAADAFVRKPFSPLELVAAVERVVGGEGSPRPRRRSGARREEQLLLYAEDMREMLELERGQRALLQRAYRDTVTALATALESKDAGTGAHSERVQRYAVELAKAVDPELLDDPSLEYGFLLHDIGKIGVPDSILLKPAPLTIPERRLMQTHTVLGEQMLGDVALLQGEGLRVVRSHHERWDGGGYPDALAGTKIPLGARVFAVADTLDAITSERPYRSAAPWDDAVAEILRGSGTQFDPSVVQALERREPDLRRIARELEAAWRAREARGVPST